MSMFQAYQIHSADELRNITMKVVPTSKAFSRSTLTGSCKSQRSQTFIRRSRSDAFPEHRPDYPPHPDVSQASQDCAALVSCISDD